MFDFIKKLFKCREPQKKPAPAKKDLVGNITHYYGNVNAAVVQIKNGSLSIGDTIRIYGKHVDFEQSVSSMEIDRKPITKAQKGQIVGLQVKQKVHEHDGVYLVATNA